MDFLYTVVLMLRLRRALQLCLSILLILFTNNALNMGPLYEKLDTKEYL